MLPVVHLERQIYSHQSFNNRYPPTVKEKSSATDRYNNLLARTAKLKPTSDKCKTVLKRLLPCIPHMRHYQWRQWLFGDIVSGLTLGTIHIPQCLGYAAVVQVLPAFGLYSSFFPILIYFIFGSSHGISIGTVAVISVLAGNFVSQQLGKYTHLFATGTNVINLNSTFAGTTPLVTAAVTQSADTNYATAMAIVNTAAFIIGVTQLGMGILRLGIISSFMSTPFNSAYMTATAVHTAVSQFPPALGFKISQYPGLFTLPYQLRDICLHLYLTNPADIIAALLSMVFLIFVKEFINVKYRKKLLVPIPAELIVVIVGTFIAYMADLNKKYHMKIVGVIPLGFPAPAVPVLLPYIDSDFFVGCLTMTIVACVECLTMAKILARKYRYNVNANQEFIAYGLVHFISSFFHCFPTAQSPPRTMIFDTTGGKTQLSSLVAALLVLIVIVGIGPLFQNLPKACLAAIVIVGVFPLLKHVKELKFYWKVQKWDFLGWILTCLSVLVLDLAVGLGVGIGWNLLIILVQSLFVRGYTMSSTNEADIFVRSKSHYNIQEVEGIKIFRFESDLFFANVASFKNQLYEQTVHPYKLMLIKKKYLESETNEDKVRHRKISSNANGGSYNMNDAAEPGALAKPKKTPLVKLEIVWKKMLKKTRFYRPASPSSSNIKSSDADIPMENTCNVYTVNAASSNNYASYVNEALETSPADVNIHTTSSIRPMTPDKIPSASVLDPPSHANSPMARVRQTSVSWKVTDNPQTTGYFM